MLPRPRTLLAATLIAGGVVAYGVFTWISTERSILGAAEAEGRALLHAVATGIESNLLAARAGERQLADQLFRDAGDLDRELAGAPGRDSEMLARWVRRHGLRAAVLLDDDLEVLAQAHATRSAVGAGDSPFGGERLARLEADALARRASEAGLADAKRVVLGFGENPFAPRTAFLVGSAAPARGGYLLLQQDARALADLRADRVIERLLRDTASTSGIAYLLLQDEDGRILAADTPEHRELDLQPPTAEAGWRSTGGGRLLDVALPAPSQDRPRGHLRVGLDAAPIEALQERSRRDVVVFSGLLLAVGAGGLMLLGSLERKEARLRKELDERERFASLGRLAGGVAHEIRSPLNALSMAGQRLRREAVPENEDIRKRFDAITRSLETSIRRLDRTVEEFLSLGRPGPPPQPGPLDLRELVTAAAEQEQVEVDVTPQTGDVPWTADRKLLLRSVANILRNARQAEPGRTVDVVLRTGSAGAEIRITDRGPGLAEDVRAHLFDPFFTGRPDGTGLGLTLARDGVERHGGRLSAEPSTTGGASFVIRLPPPGDRP